MDMTVPELHVCEWEERRARKRSTNLTYNDGQFPRPFPGHSQGSICIITHCVTLRVDVKNAPPHYTRTKWRSNRKEEGSDQFSVWSIHQSPSC